MAKVVAGCQAGSREARRLLYECFHASTYRLLVRMVGRGGEALGYVPVSLRRNPVGYRLRSAYLLEMPCCRCMQAVYERSDGQIVAVFEKSPDHPLEFGDRPSICTQCNGQPCQLTQADGRLVVSCQLEDRQLAIVGVQNMDEAHALLAWLHENSRLDPKRS